MFYFWMYICGFNVFMNFSQFREKVVSDLEMNGEKICRKYF